MSKVKIVTDSTADIPADLVEKLGITVVPLKVLFGEESYLDGVTIKSDEFYEKLQTSEDLPTTSQPSPIDFVDAYKKLALDEGEDIEVVSIHLSSALSGTVQSAQLAQSMLEDRLNIHVIDSKKAAYALGVIVVMVAEAANAGESAEECIRLAKHLIQNSTVYFLVDTLEYLQKGGRIGKASAVLGSLLNIKPILSLDEDGEVYAVDKVRGTKKALKRMIQSLQEFASGEEVHLAICHAAAEEEAHSIMGELKKDFKIKEQAITNIGPVIGTHVGPKTIGILVVRA